jgi:hypothetical protein
MSYKLIHSYDTFRLLVQYLAYTMFVVSSRMMPRHGKQTSKHFLFPKLKCEILTLSLWRVCLVEGENFILFKTKFCRQNEIKSTAERRLFSVNMRHIRVKRFFSNNDYPCTLHLALSQFFYPEINNKHSRNIAKIIARLFPKKFPKMQQNLERGNNKYPCSFRENICRKRKCSQKIFHVYWQKYKVHLSMFVLIKIHLCWTFSIG